jgi:hypothetical protein
VKCQRAGVCIPRVELDDRTCPATTMCCTAVILLVGISQCCWQAASGMGSQVQVGLAASGMSMHSSW